MRPLLSPLVALLALASLPGVGSALPAAAGSPQGPPTATLEAKAAPVTQNEAGAARGLDVRYLGNEGFLVSAGGRRVLVDGLFGDGIPGYAAVDPELRAALERGGGDLGAVDVALATHYHGDHFDAEAVARFLAANPRAVFVSTPQARARLEEIRPQLLDRFRAVLPAAGEIERLEIDGVVLEVLNLHHGRRDPPVENLGFVVTFGDGRRFLHFGDTEAKLEDFEPYLGTLSDTDLALLPFWFLSSEWRAEMVRDRIRPRWVVVAHTPLPTAPAGHFARWESYDNLLRVMTAAFPEAEIPRESGESWRFGATD